MLTPLLRTLPCVPPHVHTPVPPCTQAIDNKQLSAFGVRTLCHLELNDATLAAPLAVGWVKALSLLDYAAWRGRGHIILALLRGGADPGVTAGCGGCREQLLLLPGSAAVWAVQVVMRLRFATARNVAAATASTASRRCGTCNATGANLATWPCGHSQCVACTWTAFGNSVTGDCDGDRRDGGGAALALLCPACFALPEEVSLPRAAAVPVAASSSGGAERAVPTAAERMPKKKGGKKRHPKEPDANTEGCAALPPGPAPAPAPASAAECKAGTLDEALSALDVWISSTTATPPQSTSDGGSGKEAGGAAAVAAADASLCFRQLGSDDRNTLRHFCSRHPRLVAKSKGKGKERRLVITLLDESCEQVIQHEQHADGEHAPPTCEAEASNQTGEEERGADAGKSDGGSAQASAHPPPTSRAKAPASSSAVWSNPLDWQCVACGYTNFIRRERCRNCNEPPETTCTRSSNTDKTIATPHSSGGRSDGTAKADHSDGVQQHEWSVQYGFPCGAGKAWDALKTLAAPSERCAASLAMWQLLPAESPDDEVCDWRLEPLPPAVAAAAAAAARKDQKGRQSDLLRAAKHGDALGVVATIAAGVCVNTAADECGLTAVMLAAWCGRLVVLKALAWAGATFVTAGGVPLRSPSGATAWEAATAQGHTLAAAFIAAQYATVATGDDGGCSVTTGTDEGSQPAQRSGKGGIVQAGFVDAVAPKSAAGADSRHVCGSVTPMIPVESRHRGAGAAYLDGAGTDAYIDRLYRLFATLDVTMNGADYGSASRGKGLGPSRRHFCDVDGWVRQGMEAALQRYAAHLSSTGTERSGSGGGSMQVSVKVGALPRMRFLCYDHEGGIMAPHVDLTKPVEQEGARHRGQTLSRGSAATTNGSSDSTSTAGLSSTHTFILHLVSCQHGGETVMLRQLASPAPPDGKGGIACVDGGGGGGGGADADADGGGGGGGGGDADADALERSGAGEGRVHAPDSDPDPDPGPWILGSAAPARGRLVIFPHICPHAGLPTIDAPKVFLRGELIVTPLTGGKKT